MQANESPDCTERMVLVCGVTVKRDRREEGRVNAEYLMIDKLSYLKLYPKGIISGTVRTKRRNFIGVRREIT